MAKSMTVKKKDIGCYLSDFHGFLDVLCVHCLQYQKNPLRLIKNDMILPLRGPSSV